LPGWLPSRKAARIPAAGATVRSEEKISRMRVDTLHARVRILVYEYFEDESS
jgi:hypothetical protein